MKEKEIERALLIQEIVEKSVGKDFQAVLAADGHREAKGHAGLPQRGHGGQHPVKGPWSAPCIGSCAPALDR